MPKKQAVKGTEEVAEEVSEEVAEGKAERGEMTLLSFTRAVVALVEEGEKVVAAIGGDLAKKTALVGIDSLKNAQAQFTKAVIEDK